MCGKYSKNECDIKKFGPNYILYNEYAYIYFLCDVFFYFFKINTNTCIYLVNMCWKNSNEFRLIKKG